MDYGNGTNLGTTPIASVDATAKQSAAAIAGLSSDAAYRMVGATAMIGHNDDSEIFSLDNATALIAYAKQKKLGLVSFWAIQRDEKCAAAIRFDLCTGVNASTFQFHQIFDGVQALGVTRCAGMSAARTASGRIVERRPSASRRTIATSWLAPLLRRRAHRRSGRLAAGAQGDRRARALLGHVHRAARIRFEVRRDHVIGADVFRDAVIHTRIAPTRRHRRAGLPALPARRRRRRPARRPHGGALAARSTVARRAQARPARVAADDAASSGACCAPWPCRGSAAISRRCGTASARAAWRPRPRSPARSRRATPPRSAALFVDDAPPSSSARRRLSPRALSTRCRRAAASTIDAPVTAGWTTSFRFRHRRPAPSEGLALLEFARDARRIRRARFFVAVATADTESAPSARADTRGSARDTSAAWRTRAAPGCRG